MNEPELLDESYYVLKELDFDPDHSQRSLARQLGYSLGKMNFILKALTEKGLIKMENFAQSPNKAQYRYVLTPGGIKEKVNITQTFISRKELEYEKIQQELESARKLLK